MRPTAGTRRLAAAVAAVLTAAQVAAPPRADAAALGSTTASAGSVPPPAATAIESFQPDLFTGRATTALPLAVPAGRKGVQPALALTYSSSARNGWLGVGWSLDLGAIERSTKNGVPTYNDATDTFTLLFQGAAADLVKIPDGTYRAETEGAFLRIARAGLGWEVRDKSGTRYLFGQTAATQTESGGKIFRWALEQLIDPNGNGLTISYAKDAGQLYPARITYTTTTVSGGPAPANQIDFLLEGRADAETTNRPSFPVTTAKRLKTVEARVIVSGTAKLARRYDLAYGTSSRTGRSLLSGVTQIGTDGSTKLPPTSFTYEQTAPSYTTVSRNNPTTSTPAWNVQIAGYDAGHNNHGVVNPYAGLPWGPSQVVQGAASLGCVSVTANSNGSLTLTGCQDTYVHAWTWLYTSAPRQLSVQYGKVGCDSNGSVWQEDTTGLRQVTDTLALQPGWSLLHVTDYHQHDCFSSALDSPLATLVERMAPSQFVEPRLAGDVDGNAIPDLITVNLTTGTWTVACGRGCLDSPETTWLTGFGDSASIPLLGDWDADGRTDIGVYNAGRWQFAMVNTTSSGFQTGSPPMLTFGSGTPLTGDFNGDGRTDLGTYNNGAWSIALASGTTFAPAAGLSITGFGSASHEPLTGDFNGDGLTDLGVANRTTGAVDIRLSTGTGFAPAATAIAAFGAGQPHLSADFNGDGLTDLAFYNKTAGQIDYATSTGTGFIDTAGTVLPPTFTMRTDADTPQLADFNGDGLADPAVFNPVTGNAELAHSHGALPDLLTRIANGVGGTTSITYQMSTTCDNLCPIERIPKLPFVLPLASRVTVDNGLGHQLTTTYEYEKGRYDAAAREFLGFARVEVRDPLGGVTITEFHQDPHKKGRPFSMERRDADDNVWTRSTQTWSCTEPYPNVHFVTLDRAEATVCDGDATCRTTGTALSYDVNGNVTQAVEEGDVAVAGNERTTVTSYAPNTAAWILNRPRLVQTLNGQGAVIAQRRFFYDGATDPLTPPTKGNLTKEEAWRNLPTEQWYATSMTYDALGNATAITDALGRVTTNTYDASGTFLTTVTNQLGHARTLAYDPVLGAVTTSTDPNTVSTTTQYDALGRVTAVIGPTDTAALPTLRYEYDPCLAAGSCAPPIRSTVRARVASGQTAELTTYAFADGLGRTIQTRAPAETSGKQVVSGAIELDTRGLVAKQWAPYLDTASTSYVPVGLVAGVTPPVLYAYDPMGRLIRSTEPDTSSTSVIYDDWTVTTVDPKGTPTRRTQDALGRLATVQEANGSQTSTTTYTHDALNNLIKVVDAAGNVTSITYDSLSRKLSLDDPDMGRWQYAYDAVDNLTSQTDARGVTATFTSDALNRVTRKAYASADATVRNPGDVVYTYDVSTPAQSFSKGRLVKIVDGSGSADFVYDALGRLIKESKTLDGSVYAIQRAYDLLGRLTALTYPDGESATYTYNAQGGIDTVALQSPTSGQTPLVSGMDYNAAGQLTTIAYGNGTRTTYAYNPQTLRLQSLSTLGPTGPLQQFGYQFDPAGNLTQITDALHTGTQSFTYDPLHRLTQAAGSYGTLTYRYDALGNLLEKEGMTLGYGATKPHAVTSLTQPGGSAVTLRYDLNGNLLEKPSPASPLLGQTLAYDVENRLVEARTPQEETVTVTFKPGWNFFSLPVIPANASVTSVLPTFAADFAQLTRYDAGTYKHYVNTSKFDDFSTLDYGVGYQVYCKNPAGVTVSVKGQAPSSSTAKSLPAGWHLLSGIMLTPTAVGTVYAGVDQSAVRGYDTVTRSLTTATQTAPAQAYYVQVRTTSSWQPPLPRDVKTQFVYDGDGGRVKQITAAGTTKFLGQAYEIAPDGTRTKYVFAGPQRIAAIETPAGLADAPVTPERAWARWWRQLVDALAVWLIPPAEAAVPPANLQLYHPDHLGSSNVVTNGSGALVELAEHTPFGALHRREGTADVRHKFTGQDQDRRTGLVLFPARAYDPVLGRFLQADPLVQDPADPQSLNRYAYVRNNPAVYTDPTGHFWDRLTRLRDRVQDFLGGNSPHYDDPFWWAGRMIVDGPNPFGSLAQTQQVLSQAQSFLTDQLGLSPAWANAIIGGVVGALAGGYLGAIVGATTGYLGTVAMETKLAQQAVRGFAEFLIDAGVDRRTAYAASEFLIGFAVGAAIGLGVSATASFVRGFAQALSRSVSTAFEQTFVSTLEPNPASPSTPTAATPLGRSIESLKSALRTNDPSWRRVSAHFEEANGRRYQGGTSIEEVFRNQGSGETIVRHRIYGQDGDTLHETYRRSGKFGTK